MLKTWQNVEKKNSTKNCETFQKNLNQAFNWRKLSIFLTLTDKESLTIYHEFWRESLKRENREKITWILETLKKIPLSSIDQEKLRIWEKLEQSQTECERGRSCLKFSENQKWRENLLKFCLKIDLHMAKNFENFEKLWISKVLSGKF